MYLTTAEVAEITRFAPKTIRKFARLYRATKRSRRPRGLKGFQPDGRSWRFRPEDVENFMLGAEQVAKARP
ncbi:helix-turn-helix domain-containing protein [Rhodococcus hoagii]|nr:helix-turn-helix domain-containing protein [Prescottella equi]